MGRSTRLRHAGGALITLLAFGCGARTELFGELPEESAAPDSGGADAPVDLDAAIFPDASVIVDAATAADASSGIDANGFDASIVDAGTDAAITPTIRCDAMGTTLLTSAGFEADQILVDGSYVYFHDETGIWRVPKNGGAKTLVAQMKSYEWPNNDAFLLDDTGIIWWSLNASMKTTDVNRVAKSGGAPQFMVTVTDYDYFGASAGAPGNYFIWSGGTTDFSLWRIYPNDGAGVLLSNLPVYTDSVLSDGVDTYAASMGGVQHLNQGAFELLSPHHEYSFFLTMDDASLYYVTSDEIDPMNTEAAIRAVPRAGGAETTLLDETNKDYANIVIDGEKLYVPDRIGGVIYRMNKADGSNRESLVSGFTSGQICGVAVDADCIYWTAAPGGSAAKGGVYAMPKP